MDLLLAQIRADISSGDPGRQVQGLVQALQCSATGKDVSSLVKSVCDDIVSTGASPLCKKLAYDVIRTTRLTAAQWETICKGLANDFDYHDRDVTAAGASFIAAIPSWRVGKFILEYTKEISACIVDPNPNLRHAIIEALGCVLARDDIVTMCAASVNLLDRVHVWYKQLAQSMLDPADLVSKAAFEAVGHLFSEFSSKRLSRMAGERLAPGDASLAVRCAFVLSVSEVVWSKRDLLMARAAVLPLEFTRYTVFPLVFAAKARATGLLDEIRTLAGIQPGAAPPSSSDAAGKAKELASADTSLGIADLVSHLVQYLYALDPALVYEIGINLLQLAAVPGGKAEWASAPVTALLSLWDRQGLGAGREAIVRAVAGNIHLLDIHLQVSLFKRLLVLVRNLRVEADRMHALACVCRTALAVDLFVKESVRRGQKPLAGTDISSLFEDSHSREELAAVSSTLLFREELVACLVESCFQLAQPLPPTSSSGTRVLGALASATGHEAMGWTHAALDVVEVCRPCLKWDCGGRTYAMECYLRLLVRLCHLYETVRGVKSVKDGATPEQILAEQRLEALQRQLLQDLKQITTQRMRARVVWTLAEHINLEGMDPILADDPTDPLAILARSIHDLLFTVDPAIAASTDRLADVQALLLVAQHLGSRSHRAAALLQPGLEAFMSSPLADTVNKNQCRLVLQLLKYSQEKPQGRWAGWVCSTGEYPFGHQKLSVQYNDPSSIQDRKLEGLVRRTVRELWRPPPSDLSVLAATGEAALRTPPPPRALSGSSDPCYVEASHLSDEVERKITLSMKVVNIMELELPRVDVRVGLTGALQFLDSTPQALRQLRGLLSQDPTLCDVTVTVSRFERCSLCVHLLYFPSSLPTDEAGGGYDDQGGGSRRQSQSGSSAGGETREAVVLRCKPYRLPLTELLLPWPCAPVDFFRIWPNLPAVVEYAGTYSYEPSERDMEVEEVGVPHYLIGLAALKTRPLFRVCSHLLRTTAGFQLCYLAKTWFGDTLAMVIFGNSDPGDGGFGEETATMVCDFVVRSSSDKVLEEIEADVQNWFDDLTDGALRVLSESERRSMLSQKLKRVREAQALTTIKQAPVQSDGSLVPGLTPLSQPIATGQEEEARALQAAVLQEWQMLKTQQVH